ncbi:hypothetical protein J1N35_035926 [Gossypium stocksii]|uniref:Uncharacterized protein n=1 Tax=Gossypium stocksii TaxID=47602 RepID=A0A9D3ZQJ7_9ROSI|nr:hypothetical protein J1N35_035926 [Gossypium stocksii]
MTSLKILKKTTQEVGGAWPIIGHLYLLGGSQPPHISLGNLADKYGGIFTSKLGVHRALVVSHWEIAKECLTINDKAFATRPKLSSSKILRYNCAMIAFALVRGTGCVTVSEMFGRLVATKRLCRRYPKNWTKLWRNGYESTKKRELKMRQTVRKLSWE